MYKKLFSLSFMKFRNGRAAIFVFHYFPHTLSTKSCTF